MKQDSQTGCVAIGGENKNKDIGPATIKETGEVI